MLTRDNYRLRLERGEPVGLHEFFYALLQGYDAVHLRADVQLGATEQLFNILAGAKLQEAFGQPPCVALTFPILLGTDGVERMAKSRGNYVGLTEASDEQFGKVMSISDATMLQWVSLVTDWSEQEVLAFRGAVLKSELHPMEAKKLLARHVVALYHGTDPAKKAGETFHNTHQLRLVPENVIELSLPLPLTVTDVLHAIGAATSKSNARRLILSGGVTIDGEKITSVDDVVATTSIIKVGPRRYYRVTAT